jgi:hypothetical protein
MTWQVALDGAGAEHVDALSRLGADFGVSSSGEVHLVEGGRGWAKRAAHRVASGLRAVVVDRPVPEPIQDVLVLQAAAAEAGAPVLIHTQFEASPQWADCRDSLAFDMSRVATVMATARARTKGELDACELAMVLALSPLLPNAALRRTHAAGRVLHAFDADRGITMSTVVSVQTGLALDAIGEGVRWRVEVLDETPAGAGRAVRIDAEGAVERPPRFGGAARRTWNRLAGQLDSGTAADDLDRVVRALGLLEDARTCT